MKVTIIQKDVNNRDYLSQVRQAAATGPDLICLGELATSGCLYHGGEGQVLGDVVRKLGAIDRPVLLGFPQETEYGLYNACLYYSGGHWQVYHKINLFEPMNEPGVYLPGDEPGLFDTVQGEIGAAICYDLRFPELFATLKDRGAQVIFVPAAWPRVRIDDWRRLLIERAKENGLPVVGINCVGDDGTNEFGGSSMAVDAAGNVLVQAEETGETHIEVEL